MPKIRILHSDTPGAIPPKASLQDRGRIAINHADGILFWIDADNNTIRSFNFLNPTVPDQASGNNTTKAANTKFVQAALSTLLAIIDGTGLVAGLSDLTKIAAALNNDANFSATVTAAINNRVRFDAAQALTGPQKAQALANMGVAILSAAGYDVGTSGTKVALLDGKNRWDATQVAKAAPIVSGTAPDFSLIQNWDVEVNGSTFAVVNPATPPPFHGAFLGMFIKITTANLLTFGTKFRVGGYVPSGPGNADNLTFRYHSTDDLYYLVGIRNQVNL